CGSVDRSTPTRRSRWSGSWSRSRRTKNYEARSSSCGVESGAKTARLPSARRVGFSSLTDCRRTVKAVVYSPTSKPSVRCRGRISPVGRAVTQFRVGDDVFGASKFGGFAEFVCVNEQTLVPKPAGISFDVAAATPTAGYTALQGLHKGRIAAGQKVLIDGASGGVGTFAIQIARAYGADITAVCSTRNVDTARALGASRVIDYRHEDFASDGQRYDLILAANAYRPLSDYRRALKPGGAYVMTGGGGLQILQAMLLGAVLSVTSSRRMGNLLAIARKEDL